MQIFKGSMALRRLKFGICDVLVARKNCTLQFFNFLIFWPCWGVQISNIGQIWPKLAKNGKKMAKIELWTPREERKIEIYRNNKV